MRAHYIEKFWQAYLGRAYSLWSLIQADNRQNKFHWTRAKKYRYRYLARSLGCAPSTITRISAFLGRHSILLLTRALAALEAGCSERTAELIRHQADPVDPDAGVALQLADEAS